VNLTGDKNGPFCFGILKNNLVEISCMYIENLSSAHSEASDVFIHEFAVGDVISGRVGRNGAGSAVGVYFRTVTLAVEKLCKNIGGSEVVPSVPILSMNTSPQTVGSYIATATETSVWGDNFAYRLFDNEPTTHWHSDATIGTATQYSTSNGYYLGGPGCSSLVVDVPRFKQPPATDEVAILGERAQIDFGTTYRISQYTLDARNDRPEQINDGNPNQWTIAVSDNGVNWTAVDIRHYSTGSSTTADSWNGSVTFTLAAPVDARFVTIIVQRVFTIPSGRPEYYASFGGLRFA